jgi:hypothetical protein
VRLSFEEINAAYERLAYPYGRTDRPMRTLDIPLESRHPVTLHGRFGRIVDLARRRQGAL